MNTETWLGVERLPRFSDPMTALLWGSRIYLVHATSGEPVPPLFNLLFSHVLSADTQPAITEVLDFLMYHSTVPVAVHALDCTCVSIHEQALADGIRAISAGSLSGYCEAMSTVLIREDAMTIGPSIQSIAAALNRVQATGFVQSANVIAPRAFVNTQQAAHWH